MSNHPSIIYKVIWVKTSVMYCSEHFTQDELPFIYIESMVFTYSSFSPSDITGHHLHGYVNAE